MASQVLKWRKTKRISLIVLCVFAVVGFTVYFRLFRSEPVTTHNAAKAISIAKPIPAPAGFASSLKKEQKTMFKLASRLTSKLAAMLLILF